MTKKVYKTSRGKVVDLGALILQNENTRAVGNMNVNARGDILDSADRVIDSKNSQIQRQNDRQIKTNVQDHPVHTSNRAARQARSKPLPDIIESVLDTSSTLTVSEPVTVAVEEKTGLAAAMIRSKQSLGNE